MVEWFAHLGGENRVCLCFVEKKSVEMAAKLLHSLADENPDLQKQIGCMTGIFQLFDRQHVLTGRHISPNRLLAGNSHINGSDLGREYIIHHREPDTEMRENGYQKQRVPIELSRASFSSTCSSSFSSVECSKVAQLEMSSFDQIISHEMSTRDPAKNKLSHLGRNPHDFRDVVKDSIYRDPRMLSVKKPVKEEALARSVKLRDSPRPSQFSESKQSIPVDLQESLRVLGKLRDVPWQYEEARAGHSSLYEAKDETRRSMSKDGHRFSYDGREINRLSFESREAIRSARKLKELPRLSLDSRDRSINGSHSVSILSQKRPPSVVAKLMGLEALPDSSLGNETLSKSDSYSSSLDEKSSIRRIIIPDSPNSLKGPNSPRWKNPNLIMKPVLSSKFPNEAAPWRHLDGNGGSLKPSLRQGKGPVKATNSVPSVYSEIDKRLKELEFSQSGKDLRALKQILEAMQTKGLLDAKKEELTSNHKTQKDYSLKSGNMHHNQRVAIQQNVSSSGGPDSSRVYESPIVIMKPAKLVNKSDIPTSSVTPMDSRKISRSQIIKDGSPQTNRIGSVTSSAEKKTSSRNVKSGAQQQPKENTVNSTKSSGSLSPRLQQKKLDTEKRSRPPAPPSDSKQIRRTSNQKVSELSYRGGKLRPKSSNSLQSDDHLSDISNESRTLSCLGDDTSLHSDSNLSIDSKVDMEVASNEQLSTMVVKYLNPGVPGNDLASRCNEYNSEEIAKTTPDHRSPVSILDASVYGDDEQSPVKQNQDPDYAPDEYKWCSENIVVSSSTGSEINRKKLQNIDNLVQKLRRLNSHHDEAKTDYIASLCESSDPDHRYISEILLASGLLLRDLGSGLTTFQLHPSGHPINPELFFVLEQTKMSKEDDTSLKLTNSKSNHYKFHRKLIFDAVNEILAKQLAFVGASSDPWLKQNKLARKTLRSQKILKELCLEIEQFKGKKSEGSLDVEEDGLKNMLWEDVMVTPGSWTDLDGEIPSFVLDVERSIFKDLVDEIVIGEKTHLRAKSGRCKQLFAK